MDLRWTSGAAADLEAIVDHIWDDNPAAATDVLERILARIEELSVFPRLGRPGRAAGTRELPIVGLPYIVVYRIHLDAVAVLRVLHGAQNRP